MFCSGAGGLGVLRRTTLEPAAVQVQEEDSESLLWEKDPEFGCFS